MSDQTNESGATSALPDAANYEWLRKQAKQRLRALRESDPSAQLSDAQFALAREYGFASWRALKARVDLLTVEGQVFDAARNGDTEKLASLLDAHPEMLQARAKPYGHTLLHLAAKHAGAIALLLARGLDANLREHGDETYAMHWAAAAGKLDAVRVLADAGGDVIGPGDDHQLEVIGWATCWDDGDDDAHRAVADFLVSRGAKHHIFSAIALSDADEVRRIVSADGSALSRRMSRNEDHQQPLHFAVRMGRAAMVSLLIELGADPLGTDNSGNSAAAYALSSDIDRSVMHAIHKMTAEESSSASRGFRRADVRALDLIAALSLHDMQFADRIWAERVAVSSGAGVIAGTLPVMAKRGDARAVRWLLDHGVDPDAKWSHWGAEVTALHLASLGGHPDVAKILLAAGADTTIRDTQHNGDALDWARFFKRNDIVALIEDSASRR